MWIVENSTSVRFLLGIGMSKERGHVRKGDLTRAAILDVALDVASRDGLEGVTIGILADR